MRSNVRPSEPVRPSMRRRRPSFSRASRLYRSPQRACSSRSWHWWHGWARSARRRRSTSVSPSGVCSSASRRREPRGAVGQVERADARREVAPLLRRAVVDVLGHPHRGQHVDRGREVDHRQPPRPAALGDHERARVVAAAARRGPARRRARPACPRGTRMTSPRRSASSEAATAPRRRDAPSRASSASRSLNAAAQVGVLGEVAEVAAHLPRVLGAASARCAGSARAGPATPRSAWNCANEASSSSRAAGRPIWATRLTAMLYDGRNDERSG